MAKRAPILPENYNPVGERLKRVMEAASEHVVQEEKVIELHRPVTQTPLETPIRVAEPIPQPKTVQTERRIVPEIPTDKETKDVSVKFRCTLSERKKWHEITREISGDHSQLSHFVRACLLLLENSQSQLERIAPDIQRLKKPSSADTLGLAIYEQQLAQYLFDAIKSAGRPRG